MADADPPMTWLRASIRLPVQILAYGIALRFLWAWFVIDPIRAEPINLAQALGLATLCRVVLWPDDGRVPLGAHVFYAVFALVTGFALHLFT